MRAGTWSVAAASVAGGDVGLGRRGGLRRLVAAGLLLLGLVLVQALALAGAQPLSAPLEGLKSVFSGSDAAPPPAVPSEREIAARLAGAPVGFVANEGQAHRSVSHIAQGPGYAFAFGERGVRVSLVKQAEPRAGAAKAASLSLGLSFVGANHDARAELAGKPGGRANYLVGERSRWRAGLAVYPELVYRDLWPGVDMAFSGSQGKLKYEFRVAPGADPSRIQLAYQGADSLSLTSAGALAVNTKQGVLKDKAPVSYQRQDGARVPVNSSFATANGHSYGFTVGAYDQSRPLVIDPALEYSTYLGGSDFEAAFAIDVEGHDAYVTGGTGSSDLPTTPNAFDRTYNGAPVPPGQQADQDAFVAKLDTRKDGAASLQYLSYLGGGAPDAGFGIDAVGNDVYVAGATFSPNFPTTPDGVQTVNVAGEEDAFLTRLDIRKGAAGLEYSTYLGGGAPDRALGLDVRGHDAFITGFSEAPDFPTTRKAYDRTHNGGQDAFVTRLDTHRRGAAGLEYSTYLGGGGAESGRGILVKGDDAYLTGETGSADFPTTRNAYDRIFNGGAPPPPTDAFVARLDTDDKGTSALEYSSYLGGTGNDSGRAIAVKGDEAFVTGQVGSTDFPVTPTAFDSTFAGGGPCAAPPAPFSTCDAFVTRLDTGRWGASGLEYSTYLGGSGADAGRGIDVDGRDAVVVGQTSSSSFPPGSTAFPVTEDAFQPAKAGPPFGPAAPDMFVTRLDTEDPGAAGLEYSTYLGGSGLEDGFGIEVNGDDAFIAGGSGSSDYPIPPEAKSYDRSFNGGFADVVVTRLETKSKRHHDDDHDHDHDDED